jgi:hypothetical protein
MATDIKQKSFSREFTQMDANGKVKSKIFSLFLFAILSAA